MKNERSLRGGLVLCGFAAGLAAAGSGCSSNSAVPPTGTGGAGAAGGSTATGGAAGGSTATGGAAATGGAGTGGAPVAACPAAWTGSPTRPQLTDASADCFTIERYLAEAGMVGALTKDNWNPTAGLPAASTLTPTFTVAADGRGTHMTVQAAVAAAKAAGGTARAYILVKPGTYRELVCVDGTAPITLYGAGADRAEVTITYDNYNSKPVALLNGVADPAMANACALPSAATYGTSGSTTFFVKSNGFQAMNLTIANDFAEGTAVSGLQAVALTTQGDQMVFQNVRVAGNQDTLQVKSASYLLVTRAYFKDSFIEGDTDFIFGRGTAVFDGCTITYVAGRKTDSTHISPSTEAPNPYGFLIINSKIMGGAGITGTAALGRSWDDSSGMAPNGQAVIRETEISNHIRLAAPWVAAATSSRAFDVARNRLYEYKNTGSGAAP
ncbi:MAG: pectinesterase family protein [Pseudomonadota bacterium]